MSESSSPPPDRWAKLRDHVRDRSLLVTGAVQAVAASLVAVVSEFLIRLSALRVSALWGLVAVLVAALGFKRSRED